MQIPTPVPTDFAPPMPMQRHAGRWLAPSVGARRAACVALLVVAAVLAGTSHAAGLGPEAFEQLRGLVGTWRPADKPGSELRVEIALTAGDTVLTESWRAPGHASLTVYHLDGDRLLATHYCPRGNQPRLALKQRGEDGTLRFEFADATGLDLLGEYYEHLLTLRRVGAHELIRGEVYAEHGQPIGELPVPELTRFRRVR
jgi:hypothetical protein